MSYYYNSGATIPPDILDVLWVLCHHCESPPSYPTPVNWALRLSFGVVRSKTRIALEFADSSFQMTAGFCVLAASPLIAHSKRQHLQQRRHPLFQ